MKTYMALDGLRWSRDSGSANCDMPRSAVFGRSGGGSTSNLYKHQGKMVNKVVDHLPALQSKLVQEVLKENYDFGFATAEHEIYDEAELEEALTKN